MDDRPTGCTVDQAHRGRLTFADGMCRGCWYERKRRRRAQNRASSVRRLYGWLTEELDALKRFQGGRCAICRRRVGVVKNGAVDHDHVRERAGWPKRETVRGILCSTCNRYLGYIGDRPEVGIRLARYLIDPPAPRVLTALDRGDTLDTAGQGVRDTDPLVTRGETGDTLAGIDERTAPWTRFGPTSCAAGG